MGDLTEEEFNSLPDTTNDISEAEFNALQSDSPSVKKSTTESFFGNLDKIKELGKDAFLGMSHRGEEAAAGVADLVGYQPKPWTEKLARQNQWISEHPGGQVGQMAMDAALTIPAILAVPEVAGGPFIKPLMQMVSDAGVSGITGAITHPGDTYDRLARGGIDAVGGAIGGAAGQVLKAGAKTLGNAGRSIHDMFSDTGHMSKLADYVRQAVPEADIPTVLANLQNYKKLVPNYNPTAAEAGQHYGLNTLQEYASGVNPGQYINRQLQNIDAEAKLMGAIADPKRLAEKKGFRTSLTEPMYEAAKQTFVPVDTELVKLFKRPEMRKALVKGMQTAANAGNPSSAAMLNSVLSGRNMAQINGDALHHVKLGIDSLIKEAKNPRANLDQNAFKDISSTFENWRATNIPQYAQAQNTYRQLSKPVNRRNAAEAIIKSAYPHGTKDPAALFATSELKLGDILANPDKLIQKGTKFTGSTFDNTFTNRQKELMANISESQRRRAQSELTSGSGFQHDNSSNMAARGVGAIAQAGSGLPGMYQSATANVLSKLGSQNLKMQSKLGDILLDPKRTAELFKVAPRKGVFSNLDGNILNRIPGLIGYLSSEQYINQ